MLFVGLECGELVEGFKTLVPLLVLIISPEWKQKSNDKNAGISWNDNNPSTKWTLGFSLVCIFEHFTPDHPSMVPVWEGPHDTGEWHGYGEGVVALVARADTSLPAAFVKCSSALFPAFCWSRCAISRRKMAEHWKKKYELMLVQRAQWLCSSRSILWYCTHDICFIVVILFVLHTLRMIDYHVRISSLQTYCLYLIYVTWMISIFLKLSLPVPVHAALALFIHRTLWGPYNMTWPWMTGKPSLNKSAPFDMSAYQLPKEVAWNKTGGFSKPGNLGSIFKTPLAAMATKPSLKSLLRKGDLLVAPGVFDACRWCKGQPPNSLNCVGVLLYFGWVLLKLMHRQDF